MMGSVIYFLSKSVLIYFVFLWVSYLVLLAYAFPKVLSGFKQRCFSSHIKSQVNKKGLISIGVIIPAFNEEKNIVNAISSVLNSEYPNVEIIVVNDGSEDNTLGYLIDEYKLYPAKIFPEEKLETGKVLKYYFSANTPNLKVIDKEHSPYEDSAADCVNAGVNLCESPAFVTLDADTCLEPDALTNFMLSYLMSFHCSCIGGSVYLSEGSEMKNGQMVKFGLPSSFAGMTQIPEYLRSFLYARESWAGLGGAMSFPGALTFFHKQTVIDLGGIDNSNFSYDAEIVMSIHEYKRSKKEDYKVVFDSNAAAWTRQPNSIKALFIQRNKWQRGLLRSVFRHKKMILNPKYGVIGLVNFPLYILLEVFGPVVEALAYIIFLLALIFIVGAYIGVLWLFLLAWTFVSLITLSTVYLNRKTQNKYGKNIGYFKFLMLVFVDMLGFRQIRAMSALFGTFHYFINRLLGKPE